MSTQEDAGMEVSRHVADYRGERLLELFYGETWIAVAATPEQRAAGLFPDEIEHGEGRRGPWVKLPKSAVERRVKITVEGTWRGEPVTVVAELGGELLLHYDRSPARARELGMEGDPYNGWQIRVPADEVVIVGATEKDY